MQYFPFSRYKNYKNYIFYKYYYIYYIKKIHTKLCNPYNQRVCEIFEDVHIPFIWRNFAPSLTIVRKGVKDPPYMQNMKVYFLGSDKKPPALLM